MSRVWIDLLKTKKRKIDLITNSCTVITLDEMEEIVMMFERRYQGERKIIENEMRMSDGSQSSNSSWKQIEKLYPPI